MEGFLSLDEAAERLQTSPNDLTLEIQAGRVVAIVREGQSWLSPGEVRRLARSREAESTEPSPAPPPEEPAPGPEPAPMEEPPMVRELRERLQMLSNRNEELEQLNKRLKTGIGETEAALRRSRNARANLENDIIGLNDEMKKAQSRVNALEREVQHLSHELERAEEQHVSDMRRYRSKERGSEPRTEAEVSPSELSDLRRQMEEKDRIIAQEYQERSTLRAQLEEVNQKYYDLKARYDKEKSEWSEILARELHTHGQLKSRLEELNARPTPKGWNPFRREK